MRSSFKARYYKYLFPAFLLLLAIRSNAQDLKIADFVVYASTNNISQSLLLQLTAKGYGIQVGSGSKVISGSIGSCFPIKTTGIATLLSNLHSGSTIQLAPGNIVTGKISAANSGASTGTIFTAGNGLALTGNLDIKGSIKIGSGSSVTGVVTHPNNTQYSGPIPSGGEIKGNPALPVLPQLPAVTKFAAAGTTDVTSTKIISPGAYGKIKLTGNSTITFSGPGVYIFSSIANSGDQNKFVFDFKNSADGVFQIEIVGDVNLGKIISQISNGGNASRIYSETHGKGSTCSYGPFAWSMDNCSQTANWYGTVYAPNAGINIGAGTGTAKVTGALWTSTQVKIQNGVTIEYAPFIQCTTPNANAGADKALTCEISQVMLDGSSTTSGVQYCWTTINGGQIVSGGNTASATVSKAGTYILTVTNPSGGCKATDTAIVTFTPCILPYYPPPVGGKVKNLIGSELSSLAENFDGEQDSLQAIFTLLHDSVLVEVISLAGKHDQLLALLQTSPYGLTDTASNGPGSLIITGKIPVANLKKLDSLPTLIDYCRPLFPPVNNSGVVNSSGDTALYTNFVRNGYGLTGEGVKVGVISNSYNTIPGNPAQTDIVNGDLPGVGNPDDPTPVHVLREYPYGRATDEGRAMLQIVHDIAPKAKLAFRTGFISAGDFAEGIRAMQKDSCNVIVDDVTYITEPFFEDGVISKAVDEVTGQGVSYFTAAGNFGNKSYRSNFNPVPAPDTLSGFAHDFGGGDIYQSLSLAPGTYTIVLQWEDKFYSLDPSSLGAKNDFDIYLRDNNGNTLFGFNRNNIGGDPIEVLPFTVTTNTTTNIMIVRASGSDNVPFKYVVFRGEPVINEYNSGTSTIVGQANAAGAMTVGAVLYSNTPAYGVNPPTIASFSSTGGNAINGVVRNKPDFAGPNGINTTVYMGGTNIDGDLFPNFFGTSAAAPHIAGVAALVMEARKKYYAEAIQPAQLRTILQNTAIDMADPGFDYTSGYGFVQADSAIRSFASPKPLIGSLGLADSSVVPGLQPVTVIVKGNYLTSETQVLFRGNALPTNVLSNSVVTATIPTFTGNPAIQLYTKPKAPQGNDGGYSNSLFFFSPVKKNITVTAKNEIKNYGEKLPKFEVAVLIDSIPIDSTNYTLQDLGLDSIYFTTPADAFSNTGIYFIRPAIKQLDPNDSADIALMELYKYSFNDGLLSIHKLPLIISPKDTTVNYGDKIGNFNFHFNYPDSLIADSDKAVFLDSLETGYRRELADATALADSRALVNGRPLVNSDLENLSFLVSARALVNARPLVNSRPFVNRAPGQVSDTTLLVDIAVASIFNYQEDSASTTLANARPLVNSRALVNARPLVNGTAFVNARPLVNGTPFVNSNSVGDTATENSDVAVIIDEEDVNAPEGDSLTELKSINLITGTTAGNFAIVPGAYLSENFDVKYGLANLNINKAKLKVKANDVSIGYGASPVFSSLITGYQYDDDSTIIDTLPSYTILDATYKKVTSSIIPAGTYSIVPGNLSFVSDTPNYEPDYIAGTLTVSCASLIVKADNKVGYVGCDLPAFTSVITGFVGQDSSTIISGPKYTLSPIYNGKAGTYSIIPSALVLAVPGNYTITYIPGTLCVNPDKKTTSKIQLKLNCIELLNNSKPGFTFRAHFSYTNYNSTPVSIPVGDDNFVKTSGPYSATQPELFLPGTGYYDVDVSGPVFTWTINYFQNNKKVTEKVVANTASPKCQQDGLAVASSSSTVETMTTESAKPLFKLYPNPAIDRVTIHIDNAKITGKDISIFDITGKACAARIISNDSNNIVLNISGLGKGMYMIKIQNGDISHSLMLMKQ